MFEQKQHINSSNAMNILDISHIFVNAEITYLNLNESIDIKFGTGFVLILEF